MRTFHRTCVLCGVSVRYNTTDAGRPPPDMGPGLNPPDSSDGPTLPLHQHALDFAGRSASGKSPDLVTGNDADSHLRGSPCSSTPDSMDGPSSSDTRAALPPSPPAAPPPCPRVCTVGSGSGGIQSSATTSRRKRNFSLIFFFEIERGLITYRVQKR